MTGIDGFKVFSATKAKDRLDLGNKVTEWVRANNVEVVEKWISQSSDSEFHCLSLVISYRNLPKTSPDKR